MKKNMLGYANNANDSDTTAYKLTTVHFSAFLVYLTLCFVIVARVKNVDTSVLETKLWIVTSAMGFLVSMFVYLGKRYFEDYLKKLDVIQDKMDNFRDKLNGQQEHIVKLLENLNFQQHRVAKLEAQLEDKRSIKRE